METLEKTARKISHLKTKTTASLLGIFAKALWKDRQGLSQGHFPLCCLTLGVCFVGKVSCSKEKGGMEVH
jgi:hypothetical protein